MSDHEQRLYDAMTEELKEFDYEPLTLLDVERLVRSRSRGRRTVVATAGVAAAVAVMTVGVTVLGPSPQSDSGPFPARSVAPSSGSELLVMPQTQLMDVDRAQRQLQDMGLRVTVEPARLNECGLPAGRVLASEPAPTTPIRAGDRIVLTATTRAAVSARAYCVPPDRFSDVLALLDLARDDIVDEIRGPNFAPRVQLWSGGRYLRTISGDDAVDPSNWGEGSPLAAFLLAVNTVQTIDGDVNVRQVSSLRDSGTQFACGSYPPSPLGGRPSTLITVDYPDRTTGPFSPCRWFRIYLDPQDRIDVVTADVFSETGPNEQVAPHL